MNQERSDKAMNPKNDILIDGKYYTRKELSKSYHISIDTIRGRIRNGKRGKDIVAPVRKQVKYPRELEVSGKTYSFTELADTYDLKLSTIVSRYRRGNRGKDFVFPSRTAPGNRNQTHVIISGKSYTLRELSDTYHIKLSTLESRYLQGIRERKLIEPIQENARKIKIEDQMYTFSELGSLYHLDPKTLKARYYAGMRGKGLFHPLKYHTEIIFKGEPTTLSHLSKKYGIKLYNLSRRYKRGLRDDALVRPNDSKQSR